MDLDDLFEFGDFFLSWRLIVGVAATAGLVFAVIFLVDNTTLQWVLGAPIGAIGLVLSFRWQIRADRGE